MRLGDPKEVGALMKKRRLELGFTQQQFAEATGVSPITIMRLELGRLGYIHERTAKALEVPAKVVKRMVMVSAPADARGNLLGQGSGIHVPRESGDATDVGRTMPTLYRKMNKRRKAELEARIAKLEKPSVVRKALLWLAKKV